jgi:hypothetical protein
VSDSRGSSALSSPSYSYVSSLLLSRLVMETDLCEYFPGGSRAGAGSYLPADERFTLERFSDCMRKSNLGLVRLTKDGDWMHGIQASEITLEKSLLEPADRAAAQNFGDQGMEE